MKFRQVIFILSLFLLALSCAAPTGKPSAAMEPVPVINTSSESLLPRREKPKNQATANTHSKGKSSSSSSVSVVNNGKGARISVGKQKEKDDKKKEINATIASAVGICFAVAFVLWICYRRNRNKEIKCNFICCGRIQVE
ncbi:hypothetical protein BZA77DRAFT_328901 [Pyronema omphalodes]|nr:hypothetical protein BZA77DRAFT_328901 [Pyronema omphalodes]